MSCIIPLPACRPCLARRLGAETFSIETMSLRGMQLANALEARRGKRGGFQEGFHSNNRTHKSSLLIGERLDTHH